MLDEGRLQRLLDGFASVRLLVLGDVVLDEYVWGDVERVSPEAPVPVVHVREETLVLGGAANVARNAVALGATTAVCSVVGDDAAGRRVADLLKDLGVDPGGLIVAPGRPTTRKTRVIARSQQVVRFDRETSEPPPPAVHRRLLEAIDAALPGSDGVVVEDYGKGVLSRRVGSSASSPVSSRWRTKPLRVDTEREMEESAMPFSVRCARWLSSRSGVNPSGWVRPCFSPQRESRFRSLR